MYLKIVGNSTSKEFTNDLEDSIFYINEEPFSLKENETNHIGNFSSINLFVGSNNSGKSRFLRGLLKLDQNQYQISRHIEDINFWSEEIQNWATQKLPNINYQFVTPINNLYKKFNFDKNLYKSLQSNFASHKENLNFALNLRRQDLDYLEKRNGNYGANEAIKSKLIFLNALHNINNELDFVRENRVTDKIYLPILRSIKKSVELNVETFEKTSRDLYNLKNEKIFTGLNLYDKVLELRNNVQSERRGFEKFEVFLKEYFFDGQKVEIISSLKEKCIILYIGGEERKIHEIGDGIQSIILLLFPVFTARKNSWIFIEEPETYLHPGLQRIFIETLMNDQYLSKQNLTYFFSTHSNHFLDLSLNHNKISIFQFKKVEVDRFDIRSNITPDKEVLDLLGVNTSSVFLANTSIWVEGPTDRKYISRLIKLYCEYHKKRYLKEDIDFAFFEYGGNLIAHYLFDDENFEANDYEVRDKINSFALSNKIYLLADSDNADKRTAKGKRRIDLEKLSSESENFNYQSTVVREIENLLPKVTIHNFMNELVNKDASYELKNFTFKQSDYKKIGIGRFYEENLERYKIAKRDHKAFIAESGTLKNDYKIKLCDFFINSDIKYEEVIEDNPVLEKIIKNLYAFIKK